MTLPTTTSAVTYAGNGVATQFDWTFPIPSGALEVYLTENDIAVLVEASAYSASGLDDSNGGTVTFAEAPALGQTITIKRNVALTQDVALVTGSAFYAEVVEGAFDRATMQIQQLAEEMGRAVQVPIGSGLDPADYLDAAARSAAAAAGAASSAAGSATASGEAQSGSEAARDEAVAAKNAVDAALAGLGQATETIAGISRQATLEESTSGTSTTPEAKPHVTPEGVAAAVAPVSANVTAVAARTAALENRLGYTLLYPGGTEAVPGTISTNQRIVVDSPFGDAPTLCQTEIRLASGAWVPADRLFSWHTGGYTAFAIASAFKAAGTGTTSIVIQAGNNGVFSTASPLSANPENTPTGTYLASAPVRVKLWKLAGVA